MELYRHLCSLKLESVEFSKWGRFVIDWMSNVKGEQAKIECEPARTVAAKSPPIKAVSFGATCPSIMMVQYRGSVALKSHSPGRS